MIRDEIRLPTLKQWIASSMTHLRAFRFVVKKAENAKRKSHDRQPQHTFVPHPHPLSLDFVDEDCDRKQGSLVISPPNACFFSSKDLEGLLQHLLR